MRRLILALSLAMLLPRVSLAAEHPEMLVSASWLQQNLTARRLTIVDVGDLASFEKAHIPGAHFLALTDLVVERDGVPNELPTPDALQQTFRKAAIPDRGRIVIYARDPIIAARAFVTFDYAGRGEDCSILDGGDAIWKAEQRPFAAGHFSAPPSDFTIRPHPEVVVRLSTMKILAQMASAFPASVSIIDARSFEQFCAGRIPGAVSVPWNENLTNGEVPLYRTPGDLRVIYECAGLDEHANAITYCRTGMQASVSYFALRYIGREVHLYDGSYIEWSR